MLKQDINQTETEQQVKFIKVIKPQAVSSGASPNAQEISGADQNFRRDIEASNVASGVASASTAAGANENTAANANERRPGGGCIPVSGMHR